MEDISKFSNKSYNATETTSKETENTENVQDNTVWYRIFLVTFIMTFARLTGIVQYSYYMVDLMEHTKVSNTLSPYMASAGVSLFQIIGEEHTKFSLDLLNKLNLRDSSETNLEEVG